MNNQNNNRVKINVRRKKKHETKRLKCHFMKDFLFHTIIIFIYVEKIIKIKLSCP